MIIKHSYVFSDNFIKVFNSKQYENFVLSIMNDSKRVFPNKYAKIDNQSNGECDFVDIKNNAKFDAKLPFNKYQIKLLTDGKRHKPKFEEWIREILSEASEYNLSDIRNGSFDITTTKLYNIMRDQILNDKDDENIIFFLPFPIVFSVPNSKFLQFATDFLKAIYNKLATEFDFSKRSIFAIYPSTEKDVFAVRNLNDYYVDFVQSRYYDKYFTHEVVDIET